MVTKKGRFGIDPYSILFNHGTSRTPFPTDALSGMVTKKGRFGTDPYDIFLNNGTTVDCKMEMKSVLRKDAVPDGCFFWHG